MGDKYCIVSNFYGHYEYSKIIKMISEEENVDAIILNGNLMNPFSKVNDLRRNIGSFLNSKKKVYILPGRTEINNNFNLILDEFKRYDNIINGLKKRYINSNESQIFFLNSPEKIYNTEFNTIKDELNEKNLESIIKKELKDPENTVFVSTYPRKFKSKIAFDYHLMGEANCDLIIDGISIKKGSYLNKEISESLKEKDYPIQIKKKNYGSKKLSNIYDNFNITKGISSFFSKGNKKAINDSENTILFESTFSKEIYYNPGIGAKGEFGIIEIENGKMKYEQYNFLKV